MKLRTVPLVVAAFAVLTPTTALTPAYAAAPDPSDVPGVVLNAPTAGHITGTVTSDQPYVAVRLASVVDPSYVPIVNGSGAFDLETWGYRNDSTGTLTVEARSCDGASAAATCSEAQSSGVDFTPVEVMPEVTGFADGTIGPDDPNPSVTISDPDGGGILKAWWHPAGCESWTDLDPHGTTQLNLCGEGSGNVSLYRCADTEVLICSSIDTGGYLPLEVRRTLHLSVAAPSAITQAHPTSPYRIYTASTGTYQVTWHLQKLVNDVPVDLPGTGGTASGTLVSDGQVLTVPGAGLEDGQYVVAGTITVNDPDFGTYTDVPLPKDQVLTVDTTGPAISSITASPTKIYPRLTHNTTNYKSSTRIIVRCTAPVDIAAVLIYRKTTGDLVRTLKPTTSCASSTSVIWNGRQSSNSGPVVPSGTYLVKVRDGDGNFSSTIGQVTVSGYRLVNKTWTHTFTPASTLADRYVGKCSTLRRPSLRGWYNSFGYYANTRCSSQTSKDSVVSTFHAIYLPNAAEYKDIRVSAYGGAAASKPGSRAVIRYLRTDGDLAYSIAMSSSLGTHDGLSVSTKNVVFRDHSFGWNFYTGFGYRYDVKSFTVRLHYLVLSS